MGGGGGNRLQNILVIVGGGLMSNSQQHQNRTHPDPDAAERQTERAPTFSHGGPGGLRGGFHTVRAPRSPPGRKAADASTFLSACEGGCAPSETLPASPSLLWSLHPSNYKKPPSSPSLPLSARLPLVHRKRFSCRNGKQTRSSASAARPPGRTSTTSCPPPWGRKL